MGKSVKTLLFGLLFCLLYPALNGQTLQANQGSSISGPEELCAEQSGTYFFDHPKNCQCDDISWTVNNGSFDPAGSGASAPNNRVVKVVWDKGVSNGKLEVHARNCYKEFMNDGTPDYDDELDKDDEFSIHLFDPGMVNLKVLDEGLLNCQSSVITLNLKSLNSHLKPQQLQNIVWTIPTGWQIQANSQINGENYGAHFPNVKISTNAPLHGNYMIFLTYTSPHFCPSKTFSRSVQLNIGDCLAEIPYVAPPSYFQSHSGSVTNFDFTKAQKLSQDKHYQFASGGELNLYENFDIKADSNTSFNAFIAECFCGSPWLDPNLSGESSVVYTGNFRKFEGSLELKEEASSSIRRDSSTLRENFQIYPNPSDGIFTIQAIRAPNDLLKIQIMDLSGHVVKEMHWKQNPESSSLSLNLNQELNGFYLIHISNLDGSFQFHQKILIQ